MNRIVLKNMNDNIDDPSEIMKMFKIQLKNNKILRNECMLRNEIIKLHISDENNEIKNLICSSILNDIIADVEITSLKKTNNISINKYENLQEEYNDLENEKEDEWVDKISPVEDSIRKSYQDEIDKLKKEKDDYKKQLQYREKKYTELNNKYNDKISPLMTDKHRLTSEIDKLKRQIKTLQKK